MQTRISQRVTNLKRRSNLLLVLLGFLLFNACERAVVYEQYQAIENTLWSKEKIYFFTFDIADASVPYDIFFEVRNNNLYPYQNIWLFCSEEAPIGDLKRDTVEYFLADDYGKWKGQGISLFHSSFLLRKNYKFPIEGQYTLGIRQGMRKDSLPGIQEIGIRLTTSQP